MRRWMILSGLALGLVATSTAAHAMPNRISPSGQGQATFRTNWAHIAPAALGAGDSTNSGPARVSEPNRTSADTSVQGPVNDTKSITPPGKLRPLPAAMEPATVPPIEVR